MSLVHVIDGWDVERYIGHQSYDSGQTILFIGKRNYGKTFAMNRYMNVREPRVLAIVPGRQFEGLTLAPTLDEALEDMWNNPRHCRRRVRPPPGAKTREWADEAFASILSDLRNSILLLDEMPKWSKAKTSDALEDLILNARAPGIRMAVGCQILKLVPYDFQSEATDLVIFKTTRPKDLEILTDWTEPSIAKKAKSLPQGKCIHVVL